jgi:AcrR family transcriptional regulator
MMMTDAPERARPRGGRPPNAMAGEVEERLLDAAARVFFERGFEGATFEQIAEAAHAGKATLYARYPGKEALFMAVIKRSIGRTLRFLEEVPTDLPLRQRLTRAGTVILDRCLSLEVISLMRVVVAEAPRFPILARLADQNGRRRAIAAVARIMVAEERGRNDDDAAAPPPYALEAARHFMDMVFAPMVLRAFMGEDLEQLKQEAPAQIAYAITLATDSSGAIFGIANTMPHPVAETLAAD